MASPQLKDGFTQIADEIIEALMRTNLSAYQSRILWVIFRKTYGFRKKEDWISNSQMIEMTGLHRSHICRTIRELKDKNMITKRGNKIGFQKDYQRWSELPKGVTSHQLPIQVKKLPIQATQLPIQADTKENIQKKPTKEKDLRPLVASLPRVPPALPPQHLGDGLEGFIRDYCEVKPENREKSMVLFLAYKKWAEVNRKQPMFSDTFYKKLGSIGFKSKPNSRGTQVRRAIALKTEVRNKFFPLMTYKCWKCHRDWEGTVSHRDKYCPYCKSPDFFTTQVG